MRSIFVPILIAAALFGVLEAVFSALDLGRGRRLFVDGGHRRDVQYIVASEEKPGWWRTQFGSKKFAEISIAPKGEAKRFVFLGASNTRSFASHLAEVQLEQASGGVATAPSG